VQGRGSNEEALHNEAASEQSHVETLPLTKKEKRNLELLDKMIDAAHEEGVFTRDDLIDIKYTDEFKELREEIKDMPLGPYLRYLVKQGEIKEVETAIGQEAYKLVDAQDSSDDESGKIKS